MASRSKAPLRAFRVADGRFPIFDGTGAMLYGARWNSPAISSTFSSNRTAADLPGWDSASMEASRAFGDRWFDERRSAVLLVPSVVTRIERNVLIHQEHPDFRRISAKPPAAVHWDARLYR